MGSGKGEKYLNISNKDHITTVTKGTKITVGTKTSHSILPPGFIRHCALISACLKKNNESGDLVEPVKLEGPEDSKSRNF